MLRKIVCIDDEPANLELLREAFSGRYEVVVHSDPEAGLAAVLRSVPDLVILDIEMPGLSGFDVCEAIRSDSVARSASVIFLTSDLGGTSMQKALHLGANDYLVKPFRVQELLNRVEFRLAQVRSERPVRCGNLLLDPADLSVRIDSPKGARTVHLTPSNFKLLYALTLNENRVLSREQMLDLAGMSKDSSDRAIDLRICRLRKELRGWDCSIEAVYGRGYIVSSDERGKDAAKLDA